MSLKAWKMDIKNNGVFELSWVGGQNRTNEQFKGATGCCIAAADNRHSYFIKDLSEDAIAIDRTMTPIVVTFPNFC